MKQSLSYYLTISIIKLKGIKKDFSEDPIDFKKVRKEDVHQPNGRFFKKNIKRQIKISNSLITEIGLNRHANGLLIFIPGGAYISGPAAHHWDSAKAIAKKTNLDIWMCNYPKSPESKIDEISDNIDTIYKTALESYSSQQISLIGDSAGGALITSLMQRLSSSNSVLPNKILLISPVMDASMTNPAIDKLDPIDPMLSRDGVLSAKKFCVGNKGLKHQMISPLYGSFDNFPKTILFIASRDIKYPDQKLAVEKMKEANVNLELIEGENMPHIWPFLPVMNEAKIALNKIIDVLKS